MRKKQSDAKQAKALHRMTRRRFLAGTSAGALSFTILKPSLIRGTAANSKIELGLIGCGQRGIWIADLFRANGGYQVVALADYFQDRVEAGAKVFHTEAARQFTGLSCYKRLLDSGVDAIAVESPPYFHPQQAEAGVEAGVHVYLAKPIGVDVPAVRRVEAAGTRATTKKQVFLIDFQTRTDPFFIEAVRRVHAGEIGKIAFGEATYHAESPWERQYAFLEKANPTAEDRLRAWGLDRTLSGDIIVEQNIHTIDVASWVMVQEPLYAIGTGGRKARTDGGDCWDHFSVLFQYPDDVAMNFSSRQFKGYGTRGGIRNRVFGAKGVLETEYGGEVIIRADKENFYRGGKTLNLYTAGAARNIATFRRKIENREYDNPTVAPSVRSHLTGLLGRKAAYEKRIVAWSEILQDQERLEPSLDGLKD